MKIHILLVLIFFNILFSCQAQDIKINKQKTVVEYITPPNGVYLYDNVFIDETEIDNIGWLEYLFCVEKDSSASFFTSQLLDSLCWQVNLQVKDSMNPYVYHYLRYPGFRYYPVVGISYEQALNYCKWRSATVTESFAKGNYLSEHPKLKDFEVVVEYRLPTKEEWEYAALGGLKFADYPYGLVRPINKKFYSYKIKNKNSTCIECLEKSHLKYNSNDIIHQMEFNINENYYFDIANPIACDDDTAFGLFYIYDSPPNQYGLFNMIGNIAEMTMTKGIAKGGSFRTKLNDFNIKTDFPYTQPKEWLGFRCVALVHIKRKN